MDTAGVCSKRQLVFLLSSLLLGFLVSVVFRFSAVPVLRCRLVFVVCLVVVVCVLCCSVVVQCCGVVLRAPLLMAFFFIVLSPLLSSMRSTEREPVSFPLVSSSSLLVAPSPSLFARIHRFSLIFCFCLNFNSFVRHGFQHE